MKLSARDAGRYFSKPDPDRTGLLIFGEDAMRVALKRQEVIAALLGPNAEEEMRLTRIPASDLRKDAALLGDAIKAQGFFPGPRVAFVEDANETVTKTITAALQDWQKGDAQVIVTAGALKASSGLRKLFEGHPNAYAAGIYDNPPTRDEIEAELKTAGLTQIEGAAMTDLISLAQELGPGDFRQTLEKLALYKLGDTTPVGSDDVLACAPSSTEADLDDVLNIVAEGRTNEIGPVMQKLKAQGMQPVGLCIGATRHFRQLYTAASDPGGAPAGIGKLRPPVYGPRRDRMLRQAQGIGRDKLEKALETLLDADLTLRSTSKSPQMAVMERALIRLAMLAQARR